jgi:catechol 2,3-dioxygenase-like lactoylglutathione lyase family enzyme
MHAVIAIFEMDPPDVALLRDGIAARVAAEPGFVRGYWTHDGRRRAHNVLLFATREAAEARLADVRGNAEEQVAHGITPVELALVEVAVEAGPVTDPTAPALAGVHHLKLPVSDLERSAAWYESRLGYRKGYEFVEDGVLRGLALEHPRGGPSLALRLAPEWAARSAGFDYFSIGVRDEQAIRDLAGRLTALGEQHAGVHYATIGWILPDLHDPDGHEVRLYTVEHHTDPGSIGRITDPRESGEVRGKAVEGGADPRTGLTPR